LITCALGPGCNPFTRVLTTTDRKTAMAENSKVASRAILQAGRPE